MKADTFRDGFGTATPTFGPAARLPGRPDLCVNHPLAAETGQADILPRTLSGERGDGSGQAQKYGNRKVRHPDGYTFDSRHEAEEYERLKLELAAGVIRELEVHPEFPLRGLNGGVVYTYTADFRYVSLRRGSEVLTVVDCKSVATRKKDTWRVIRKLFADNFGFEITEV